MSDQPKIDGETKVSDLYDIIVTPAFKLKDYPTNRRGKLIDLKAFSSVPDMIAIEKVPGKSRMIVKAFVKKKVKEGKTK